MTDYITPQQAAKHKGVTVQAIYKAIERGVLPSVRVLDRVALRPVDVDAYQPGSYGGVKRTIIRRGPGRTPKVFATIPSPETENECSPKL